MKVAVDVVADRGGNAPGQYLAAYRVRRLRLSDFRCYGHLTLDLEAGPVVLSGPNGSGKTNILEALSFLVPGRGLRGARLGEVTRRQAPARSISSSASARA